MFVSVPPEQPQLYSEQIGMLADRVGPLVEGTDLTLICLVRGGYPSPEITWMSRGRALPGVMVDLSFQSTLNSKLVIKNLSRVHQLAVYSCQASNFKDMSVSTNVTIELTRKYRSLKNTICSAPGILFEMPTKSAVSLTVFFFIFLYPVYTLVRPLVVEITFNNQPLSADRNYDIECQAIGSRPPAKITWWLNGQEVEGRSQTVRYF